MQGSSSSEFDSCVDGKWGIESSVDPPITDNTSSSDLSNPDDQQEDGNQQKEDNLQEDVNDREDADQQEDAKPKSQQQNDDQKEEDDQQKDTLYSVDQPGPAAACSRATSTVDLTDHCCEEEQSTETAGLLPIGSQLNFDREAYKKTVITLNCACECDWCRVLGVLKISPQISNGSSTDLPSHSPSNTSQKESHRAPKRRSYADVVKAHVPAPSTSSKPVYRQNRSSPIVSHIPAMELQGNSTPNSDMESYPSLVPLTTSLPQCHSTTAPSYSEVVKRNSNMSVNSAVELGSRAEGHTSWSVVKTSSSKKSTAKVASIRSSTLSVVRPTMNQRRGNGQRRWKNK